MKAAIKNQRTHVMRAAFSVMVAVVMVISMIPSAHYAYADEPQSTTGQSQVDNGSTLANVGAGASEDGTVDTTGNPPANTPATDANNTSDQASNNASTPNDPNAASEASSTEATQPAADPQARVGATDYATVAEAITSAKSGETITLLQDVDMTSAGTQTLTGKTLDLNGHAISAKNFTLVFQGDDATIKNGNLVGSHGAAYGLFIGDSQTSHNFVVEDVNVTGGINIFNANNVILRNVNVDASATNSPYYAIWCDVNAQAKVESGNFTSSGAAVLGLSDKHPGNPESTLVIEGGNFYSPSSPLVLGGNRYTPEISGGTFYTKDAKDFLAADRCIVPAGESNFKVIAKHNTIQVDPAKTTLPSTFELIAIDTTSADESAIAEDAAKPEMKGELDKAGGTDHLWTTNIVLRDKNTLEEKHDIETTFVIAYPVDLDAANYQNYTFKVMHLKTEGTSDSTTQLPEILPDEKVVPAADGLHVTSTLSPFAISYALITPPDQPNPGDQGNTGDQGTTPGDQGGASDQGNTGEPGATTPDDTSGTTPDTHQQTPGDQSSASTDNSAAASASTNSAHQSGTVANTNNTAGTTSANSQAAPSATDQPTITADQASGAEEELIEVAFGRVHIGHEAAAFLVNPWWYFTVMNELWVALFGAGLLAVLGIIIGIVAYTKKKRNAESN